MYYLNSRYYYPAIGRFISADTIDVLTATPMDLTNKNMYAYCDNNPVVRVDDGGEFWYIVIGAAVGAIIGAASSIVGQVVSGEKINWAEVGISAVSGAFTGAVTAACPSMSVLQTGLVHGGVGVATYAATEVVNDRTPTLVGTVYAGIISGFLAAGAKAVSQCVSTRYLENIIRKPELIQGQPLSRVKFAAEMSKKWTTGSLSQGTHAGTGWKANSGSRLIQWHPGGSKWHFMVHRIGK